MRLDRILVENVLGLRRADLALRARILLVAGPNGAGKSSLADAISMALLGKPRRVALKKDLGQLVTEGAKKGRAAVWADGEQIGEIKLPSGDHGEQLPAGAQYLSYVLDAGLFASATSDERRKLLFQLTGCKATPDLIEARLLELGADADKVATIKPLLLSGFPAACSDAKTRATESKGAWRAVTGETWGEKKSDGWAPELPPVAVDEKELAASRSVLQEIESDLADAQQTLGTHKAASQSNAQNQKRVTELVPLADQLKRRQAKLEEDQARMVEWAQKVIDAEQAASGAGAMECPCCNEKLIVEDGVLVKLHQPNSDLEAARRVDEYRGYLESAQRAVENSQRDVRASEDAVSQIKALKASLQMEAPAEAIANAEQQINELRQQRDSLRAKVESLQDAARALAERDITITKAAQHHADVMGWLAIAEHLSPEGIPNELLNKAMTPVNTALQVMSRLTGWNQVALNAGMELTANGRAYGLLSESERWRCDTLIALAIAQVSGLRLALLDRFDMLDLPSRAQLLGALIEMAKLDSIDTVIVSGTLKARPTTPAQIQTVWIENGVADDGNTLQKAS